MRSDNKYLEPKDDESFLEMCRLAAGQDTGGQWTDEKIDAVEAVELDPRNAVRRLFEMYTEEQQKAAEAERELAGRTTDTYVENMGIAIRITVGSLTSLYAERRKSGGAKAYIQVGNSFMGLDLGEYAAAAFADWLQPRAAMWIPVGERLPDTMLCVLAVYVKDGVTTTIRALHIAAHEAICWGYDFDEAVYDAEEDKYYYPEGWYEAMEDGEFAFVGPVEGTVTHWAQLPALPSRE